MSDESQWIFSLSSLGNTPTTAPLGKELYDRARGVEFLFRLGSSLRLPTAALCTAATWFHRFYMRFSMEDFYRMEVAASCIFLATKTEECSRKLKDVALVAEMKRTGKDNVTEDCKEALGWQSAILWIEEYLLEAISFDFAVNSPHAELLNVFCSQNAIGLVRDYAWSLANDSYRTPLCLLFTPRIIAASCYVLAQRIAEGPNSPSLEARISVAAPTSSLPTPPTHKPASPDASRFAIEHFSLNERDLGDVANAMCIFLDFYSAVEAETHPYVLALSKESPPKILSTVDRMYISFAEVDSMLQENPPSSEIPGRTPNSSHGGSTPLAGSQSS